MKNKLFYLLFTFSLLFSCTQSDDNFFNISGTVSSTDNEVSAIKTPLEGIHIYLFSAPLVIDTVTQLLDRTCVLDSTVTDSDGRYAFSDLQPADYIVLPVDSTYKFTWNDSPDSIWTEVSGTQYDYEINFSAPEPVAENGEEYFEFTFNNQNIQGDTEIQFCRWADHRDCGTFSLSMCDDWHWRRIDNTTDIDIITLILNSNPAINLTAEKSAECYESSQKSNEDYTIIFKTKQDASTSFWHYKDRFHIRFYLNGSWIDTLILLSGEELKANNEFNVTWYTDHVEIERVN